MIAIQVKISDKFYDELITAGEKLYGKKHGNKKLIFERCLLVGLEDMKKEIEENKKLM